MKKRLFNILFDVHTVTGIFISALLFVMFLCGTLSFLRDETIAWERNQPVKTNSFYQTDFDKLLNYLEEKESLDGRELNIWRYYNE